MFLSEINTSDSYWSSYKLLESQLLRLSHSICFDDNQIGVYSSELADIVISACTKIESLAKDIYEAHICPFQMDAGIVPPSFTEGKMGKKPEKFKAEKWTRDAWKFDYHCLVEIDKKYSLSKKRLELKTERFCFFKYGLTILPFYNIGPDDCTGGAWEFSNRSAVMLDEGKLTDVDWCKSYQSLKHNYIQSIPEHGTVKNAIMALSAFFLLTVYHTCLPGRRFEMAQQTTKYHLDFGSELFSCDMCNYMLPPFIFNSKHIDDRSAKPGYPRRSTRRIIFDEQYALNDINGYSFLVVMSNEAYRLVEKEVMSYCSTHSIERFDIAPYYKSDALTPSDPGASLFQKLKKFIVPPYHSNNVCIAFNTGLDTIYNDYSIGFTNYEKSKYRLRKIEVLKKLKVGDIVDVKCEMGVELTNARIDKLDEYSIDFEVINNSIRHIISEPIANIIYIRFSK